MTDPIIPQTIVAVMPDATPPEGVQFLTLVIML
jgi:hypothetical protein